VAVETSAPRVEFAPIQPLRAHEYVAEQIRRHIALRLIAPGESLPSERRLAAMFGVGRPTIQHALRLLEADHLVEARRGRKGGTFVSAPEQDSDAMDDMIARLLARSKELDELLVFRRALEPQIARRAAESRRKADVTAMRREIAAMEHATSDADYMRHDTELHLAVARATRNRFLETAAEDIRMKLNDALSLLPESQAWHSRLDDEHVVLVDAIAEADEDAAEAAMAAHVANSDRGVRAALAAIRRRTTI
jgi:GntR family transcriptional repressor for pyruvate dehydrogenase complex